MKKKPHKPAVILQHGLNGPAKWFKDIQRRCAAQGIEVRAPLMRSPRHPVRAEWMTAMCRGYGAVHDTIIVAHSLGGLATVHYLGSQCTDEVARAVIFIAAPAWYTGKPNTKQFYDTEPSWREAQKHMKQSVYLYSTDDPLVTPDHGIAYEEHLGLDRIVVSGAGHFLAAENELVWTQINRFL